MNLKTLGVFTLIMLLLSACGGDDDSSGDISQNLTGKIRGVDFTFGKARYGSISDDQYRVIAFNAGPEIVEACDSNTDDIYIDFKPAISTDRIELDATGISTGSATVVFHHPDFFENLIIDRTGYYQITSDTEESITIVMDFTFNDDNFMRGTMVADKCF